MISLNFLHKISEVFSMKKTLVSLVTAAALAGTFSLTANASAAEVTVQKGDTLWDIAKANDITIDELKEWNNLSNDLIFPNDQLKVAIAERYKIVKGDTLWGISQNYEGITYPKLAEWNSIENPDLIYAGDEIDIYVKGNPSQADQVQTEETGTEEPVEEAPADETATEEPAEETTTEDTANEEPAEESTTEDTVTEEPAEESTTEDTATEEPTEEATTEDTVNEEPTEEATDAEEKADKEVVQELTMTATAYTATCDACSGITATGLNLLENPDKKVVSVDPEVIPLGSKVWVEGYGDAIAGDTGGAITGNKIDIFIPDQQDAINYGVQEVTVKVYK